VSPRAGAPDEVTGPPAPGAPAARQLLSRADRQAQLLQAAAVAFARGGFAATSMDDVAAEAGVTKLIVYRNFASKEDLYRSVLDGVSDRLRDEWLREVSLPEPERHGFTTRALLTVARENPDGFRLLLVHAAREPQFADLADAFVDRARGVADLLIDDMIPDPTVKAWAGQVIVEYLVAGVLAWLDVGDPDEDEDFVERATQGMFAMFGSWADPDKVDERRRDHPGVP
jgi:AcrR family transcriptional regulator